MSDFCVLLQSISKLCSLCPTFVVFCSLLVNFVVYVRLLQSFVGYQWTLYSMSDFCSISALFCNLSVSISLLGHAPSFLGEFSHGTIVVAPVLSFLNMLKSCCLVFFPWRKMQKTKKNAALFEIFYLISPQPQHFRT